MYKQNRFLRKFLSWLLVTAQILALFGSATVGALQPTPEMARTVAQQAGLGDWFVNVVGQAATWVQPLWGQPKTAAAQATNAIWGIKNHTDFGYLNSSVSPWTWVTVATLAGGNYNAAASINRTQGILFNTTTNTFHLVNPATGALTALTLTNSIPRAQDYNVGTYDPTTNRYFAIQENSQYGHIFTVNTATNQITYVSEMNFGQSFNSDDAVFLNNKVYGADNNDLEIWDVTASSYSESNVLSQSVNEVAGMWLNSDGTLGVARNNTDIFQYNVSTNVLSVVAQTNANFPGGGEPNDLAGALFGLIANLPRGELNQPYTGSVTGSGGTPPYSNYTATGLPPGLTVNAATGAVTGTPTALGTFPVTFSVTDSDNFTTNATYNLVIAATGPGGVIAALWLRADQGVYKDAGVTAAANGDNVLQWNDATSNGINVSQANAALAPSYSTSTLFNYNPTVAFAGGTRYVEWTPSGASKIIDRATGTLYSVSAVSNAGSSQMLLGFDATGDYPGLYTGSSAPAFFYPSSFGLDANLSAQANTPFLLGGSWTNGAGNFGLFMRNDTRFNGNGKSYTSGANVNTSTLFDDFRLGGDSNWTGITGNEAEAIVFENELTIQEKQRVESYLALKYGITLETLDFSAAIVEGDYVATDGTTKVWNYTANTVYHNNVAGIGRDDAEALNQKQSKSINTGFQPVIGLGTIAATNAANTNTFAADKNYMLWGSSNAATSYGVSYTPTGFSPPAGYFRMARVWKVQETGTVGDVSVQGNGADHLLVSSDPTFATGVTELDLSSGSATVNFSNGQYFTFGANVTAPGGTSASLALWLKADAGTSSTTNGAAINLWADQTLLGNDAAQATGSLQPEYTANSGLFNFNPSVNFNPNARLQANISTSAPWGSNDGTVYVIYNQETGTLTWRNLVDFGTSALDSNNPQFGMTPSNVIGSWDDNGSFQTDSTFAVVNGATRMAGYDFDNNVLGGQKFHFDGRVANAGAGKKIGPTIGNFLNIGGDPQLGEHMLGQIAEVVVYQTQHDAATRQKVQSYLALKYGITLDITDNDGTIIEGDYVTTGGVKAWDKTANSSYHNDVAGIGRDDAQALYQKQSKSLATDDIITMGIGPVTTSNVANTGVFTSNLSYLIWGNNNASATTTTALNVATCAAPGLSDQRINRVWKVQETGALGKVYVQAALSAGFNANLGVYMMVSTDPTFATYTSVPMTKNGAVYDTSYNFTSGDYFTFAGNTTAPANLCTDGNKYINWWNVGWGYGVKTKTVTQGSQTFTFSFTDASNVLFAPIFYPHQFWNRLYVPRYDNNPTAAVQFKMTMSRPALSVQFEVCDVDGWFGGKDVTTFTGFLGGSPVGNPRLSKAKSFFSGWGLTLPAANQAQGSNFWWDCLNPGRVFVDFDQPVDEIRIDYTKNNRYSFKQFNDIQIGSINVQCAAPPPPPNADNIYVSKRAPQGTNLVDEPFTFAFEVENLSCQDQTTTFADTLPAGLTYLGESLITPLSGTENSYTGTQSLVITNLIVPPGKSTLNIDAQGSTAGTYNNQASITVGGNSYLSDDPNQAGSTDSTPVTLVASPFPTADIVVNKSASVATIDQNQIFTYSVQLTNNEATPVTVHFHDVLDGQMTYVAGSLVNPNGGTVQAYAGEAVLDVYTMTLPVGLSTLHMQVNTNSTPYTNVVNIAEVTPQLGSGFLSDRIQSNAVNVLITNAVPNLTIGKSGSATATQGTNFSYTLVVTNTGTAATSGVVTVADTLPAGLSFVSGSGSGFTCSAAGQVVTCTSSTAIAINGTATITLAVTPTTTGAKANTATVIGGGDTSSASSNTVNTTVNAANAAPAITSNGGGATASVSAAENQTTVTTVTATDGDGDPLTYSISGGADSAQFSINSSSGVLTFVAAPDFETPTDVGGNNVYDVQVTVSDGNGGTDLQDIAVTVTDVVEVATVTVPMKALLQGAYDSSSGLMRDNLRTLADFPLTSPYGGGEVTTAGVLGSSGNAAIVDWVLVEVRDTTIPATVVASKAGLLQRDGDIVGVNGTSTLTFTLVADNYYVAVKHRNHLGAMTAAPVALSVATGLIDFTAAVGYGTDGQATVSGVYALWMGDTTGDNQVIGAGPNNDRNTILSAVLAAPGNSTSNANYIVSGYSLGDVSLDGNIIAAGPNNDINLILYNVLTYPGNGSAAANYIVQGQVP